MKPIGMNQLPTGYFKVQQICFRNIGIEIATEGRILSSFFWNLVPIIAKLTAYIAICHFAVANIQDVDEFTKALEPFWQLKLSLLKWFTFMYKRQDMVYFVKRILSWNMEAKEAEIAIIARENKLDIYFCRLYLGLVASTGYFAVIKPLINGLFRYIVYGEFHLDPIIKATYIWDIENSYIGYALSVFWLFFAIHSLIYTSVGIDSLFSWITHNIIAQFGILEMRLKQTASELNGRARRKSITECINYYCRILRMVQELNTVFGFVMFVKFTISCLQVCFLAFQLNRIRNFGDAAFEAGFLISVALQLILYCRNGQRIRDENANVANSIYMFFQWDKLSKSSKKILLLSMVRAQKDCNISGIFFNVDLSLYLWVFKTAGSYLALLTTLDEK